MQSYGSYGLELILDLHDCDPATFTRKSIRKYFKELCVLIGMDKEKVTWWDYSGQPEEYKQAPAHLKGTTAVQFIKTSNITIHALDELRRVYVNIFSCKYFYAAAAEAFTKEWFSGRVVNKQIVKRV